MNGFTIKKFEDTASFELEVTLRGDVDDFDALVKTKYIFQERSIVSTHRWSFGLGQVSHFLEEVISMQDNLKGCARFTSFDYDELYLVVDEYGHIDVIIKDGIANYNYDVIDVIRQAMVDYAAELLPMITAARNANNNAEYERLYKLYLQLMLDLDEMLSYDENFKLERWTSLARNIADEV